MQVRGGGYYEAPAWRSVQGSTRSRHWRVCIPPPYARQRIEPLPDIRENPNRATPASESILRCSTLLKSLANQRGEFHHVYGDVHYDSLSPAQVAKHYRGDVQYCPEDDVHFPTLTVGQTLHFAAITRTPQTRTAGTREEHAQFMTALSTTVLGLGHTLNTYVGNNAIRGVSGGEKKRVSIAEAMMMRSRLNAWDNIHLPSQREPLPALRQSLRHHEGRMAYFGPANRARQYFIDMGYEPADRQTTPDFLVAVTDAKGRIPRAGVTNQPRTPEEFAEYFKKSELGLMNVEDMDSYEQECVGSSERAEAYKENARLERATTARKTR
ncbi:Brefeldin resistance protein [Salix suchowensis]|nr:Brefeldin resistance protein [Salix suchowensis]